MKNCHLKRPWCWERLRAGGEGDDRGWDGWMASLTQWTWVWVNSRSWWWTGKPGVLRFMGSQRVRRDWETEVNWTELIYNIVLVSRVQHSDTVTNIHIFIFFRFFTQTYVHSVGDAIQPSHPLLFPSPPALSLSQHPGLFQWVSSLHQVVKVLEFQLQHQSFRWTLRTDLL